MSFNTSPPSWTTIKGATSANSSSTRNALSTAETNMNASYSTSTGVSRAPPLVSAPFSLDPASADVYAVPLSSAIDQMVREAMNGSSSSSSSPLLMEKSTSSMDVTPRRHDSPSQQQQQQQQPAPQLLHRPFFQEGPSHASQAPSWISATANLQPSGNALTTATQGLHADHRGCRDGTTAGWESVSTHTSLHQGLSSPEAHHCPSLPQPLSIAAVNTFRHPLFRDPQMGVNGGSSGASGTSTPGAHHQSTTSHPHASFSSVVGSSSSRTSHSIGDGATTEAVAVGAQSSSNAATHYKTKRCRHFDQSGWCPYQHRCIFAHGDREFALYTARKNEASNSTHPKTSQQVKDHIARNVTQLVAEYEQAVSEAAASAKAKSAAAAAALCSPNNGNGGSGMTMVTHLTPVQSASQVSSAASQHSSLHLMAASPLAPCSVMAQPSSSASNVPVFHYQPQHQPVQVQHQHQQQQQQSQQQQFTMVGQQAIYVPAANANTNSQCAPRSFGCANTPVGTTFTMLPANTSMQAAPQSLYMGPPQQQQQSQPQFLFAVPSNTQGVYQLQSQSQQQQHQQFYVVEAPFFQTVQMSHSNASNAATMQQTQSTGSLHAHQSGGYVSANGAAFGAPMMMGHYV